MKKIDVYLDFDSTIVDSIKRFVDIANKKYNVNKSPKELGDYNFKTLYNDITRSDIIDIFTSKEFFNEKLEYINGCYDVLNKYKNDINFYIVTAGFGGDLNYKKEWINNNLPFIKDVYITNSNNKSVIDMRNAIQIDDIYECLSGTNAKIKILFKNNNNFKWQRHNNNDDIYEVNMWEDIDSMFEFYIKRGII